MSVVKRSEAYEVEFPFHIAIDPGPRFISRFECAIGCLIELAVEGSALD